MVHALISDHLPVDFWALLYLCSGFGQNPIFSSFFVWLPEFSQSGLWQVFPDCHTSFFFFDLQEVIYTKRTVLLALFYNTLIHCLFLLLSRHTISVQQWCHPPWLICHPAAWAYDGFSEFSRTQETRQYLAQVADQPCEETEQRQGGRPCEEAGAQAQEEPCRCAQECRSGLTERLRRQRCHTTGWDCGRGQARRCLPLRL